MVSDWPLERTNDGDAHSVEYYGTPVCLSQQDA